jgi:hypothetical protein
MSAVRDRLREQPLPGETEATARAWRVVEAALAEREPARRAPRLGLRPLRLVLVAALAGAALLAVLTPAGADVGDWIEDRFAKDSAETPPAFAALPDSGPVIAITRTGAYVVRPDGGWRRVGPFSEAGWSPRGRHVVGVDGRRLVAVTRAGTPKWTLTRPNRVQHPAWSVGDGFFVAYLEGSVLRAVDGMGNPATDKPLRRDAAPATPAWRPGAGYVVTYATEGGAVETLDVLTGRTLARTDAGAPVRELAWSRDGSRLAALSPRGVTVLDTRGRRTASAALPGVARDFALHPSGRRAAVVVDVGRETRVLEVTFGGPAPRPVFQGTVHGLAWSRDGRHLLLAWRDTGQWLLVGPRGKMRALDGVAAELGSAGGFPRVAGWCCPR